MPASPTPSRRPQSVLLALVACLAPWTPASPADIRPGATTGGVASAADDRTPEGAVRAFNAALSQRRLDAALALLLPGAVTFNLAPAHAFTAPPPAGPGAAAPAAADPLTSDLATHWRTVAPVLFATQRVYLRQVDEATAHADGRLATVWARVRTRAEPRQGTPSLLVFSEAYLLRLDDGHWRIAGIAQSRAAR